MSISDRLTEHRDSMDSIFQRLKILEGKSHPPINWSEQIEDFKDEVQKRIIDFDFRLNEMELQIEEIKLRRQPRKKKG
tara:strand:- start:716 stop:949 length:234 start_codon:yes stop_codon:yes gene_type:complete